MSTTETVKSLKEYASIPIVDLIESSTNPRKAFDEERLKELAESIRSKGVLSPLVVRRVNGHFEICRESATLSRSAATCGRSRTFARGAGR
jgi:hypothetical protein